MRSLLFVPGDSEKKLAKSADADADVLIVDLEDSVAADRKAAARRIARAFLDARPKGPRLFVRINPLSTALAIDDLAAIVAGAPDGVVLPKCSGAEDLRQLDHYLGALEAREGLRPGRIEILPIVTESARAIFGLGGYANVTPRLCAMMWGCEDLAADVGAVANRGPDRNYLAPFDLARSLCLFAAAAAGVIAVDTVHTDMRDLAQLERESRAAVEMGFFAKAAIHPAQVEVINRAFTPDEAAIAWARQIVTAFAATPGIGVVNIDGKMIDKPHLRAAERILARAGLAA